MVVNKQNLNRYIKPTAFRQYGYAPIPTQQHKPQKPLPPHKHTNNNAEEATTPVAVKIKRWEVRNRGEKEKSSNIKEGTKIQ